MKRTILLATVALMAMLVFAPVAMAQDTMMEGTSSGSSMESTTSGGGSGGSLADSGGPAILLPAAFLLLGSGILTYAVLRRR